MLLLKFVEIRKQPRHVRVAGQNEFGGRAMRAQSISPDAIISESDLSATRVSCTPGGRLSSTFSMRPASLAPA